MGHPLPRRLRTERPYETATRRARELRQEATTELRPETDEQLMLEISERVYGKLRRNPLKLLAKSFDWANVFVWLVLMPLSGAISFTVIAWIVTKLWQFLP